MKGHCRICNCPIQGRKSSKHTAKRNFLKNVNNHYQNNHKSALKAKNKRTRALHAHNPNLQDFATALQEGARSALEIVKEWNEGQYANAKMFLDAFEPVLPPKVVIVWNMIEAVHDGFKKLQPR